MQRIGVKRHEWRCPCCKNPWNNDFNAEISNEPFYAMACQPCYQESKGYEGIDPRNFDENISLKENFFGWSNGGWVLSNPIPNEYSEWNTFLQLRDLNLERLKGILDNLTQKGEESTSSSSASDLNREEQQLQQFYNAMMNESLIDELGIQPIESILNLCKSFKSNPSEILATLHLKYSLSAFFTLYSSPDKVNSNFTIATISQSGLGLPDRDYYFDEDKSEIRDKYRQYIADVFKLLGKHGYRDYQTPSYIDNQDFYCELAEKVFNLERKLAASFLTRTQKRDPKLTYNKFTQSALESLCSPPIDWKRYLAHGVNRKPTEFSWQSYFRALTTRDIGDLNVSTVEAIKTAVNVINSMPPEDLIHYLTLHVVVHYSGHLSSDFTLLHFGFYENALKGTQELRPRWKRALESLENALGDALGQRYVVQFFPEEAKQYAVRIVEEVKEALRARLQEVSWMSEDTRVEALKKMESFRVKIGYPSVWVDYSSLHFDEKKHLENVIIAGEFHNQLDLDRMNAPTDRERWLMTPQTVNAYYHPSLNEIVFPAAILQPPFFNVQADDAVNFGSLGAVVGHEMTHGFDDQGRQYDSVGNLRDWWTGEDGKEYERRADVMVRQAESFAVHGVNVKGKLTCGENIADLGGVKLALRALKKRLESQPSSEHINGFTPIQRFFLSWSQVWRNNVTKERALQKITIDPHGPHELRCNGTLSNVAEFFEAFGIQSGDPMYRAEELRVDIW